MMEQHIPGITPDEPTGSVATRWVGNGKDARQVELGNKLDAQKPRWSLLPIGTLGKVIGVLDYGAQKYSVDNWQHVPDFEARYYNAAMRHIEAWWSGELKDPESGFPHLAHAACCLLFLMWFDGRPDA